jgi:hypothetical protein
VKDGVNLAFCGVLRRKEEKNEISFEDRERTMVELKSFFFHTLYL